MDTQTESNNPFRRKKPNSVVVDRAASDIDEKHGGDTLPGELISAGSQHLHRKIGGKELQLFAVGGAIGTSLFVQMGAVLPKGGPAGLLLGFIVYGTIIFSTNQCFAEMVTYMPIPSPFVRLSGFWVDDALSFAMGWDYFFLMAFSVPYEITAINVLLTYWTDKIPVAAVVIVCLVIYAVLNGLTVRFFAISEFYMSMFKIFLMIGLMMYTFITMVGGNPRGDVYGFRYWKNPGSFVEYLVPGDLGRFCGLLSCMIQGSFTMVGPEYIGMAAGEAENPRKILRRAYSSFVYRLMFFFIGGALCIGLVIPYDDQLLADTIVGKREGSGTGAASPYVISMVKFGIKGVPDLVNALIMTSVLSCGNNVVFSAARTLHGLSLEGKAPAFFSTCSKRGLPYYSVVVPLTFCLLALLQLNESSGTVLSWFVGICTASYLLNYFGTIITYLHFYAALRRQGIDRNTLPYKGLFQPYTAWYALFGTTIMTLILGYNLFIHGNWDITAFFTNYTMVGFFIVAFVFWKVLKRTEYVWPGTADICLGNIKDDIDLYETLYEPKQRGKVSAYLNGFFE
ncbi:general amino acid permease [Blastomyces gilchristii SLH14081]|uniref:General amino acid permease n=1 Tax=Blastomyces gilchristii (strain SLH14081) TaxID=559298 RepID=A0A179UIB1_BLAGS|nr:general amino acid permease [Blastomyces gilchristii SLH14081]OAT07734.1 general amino acid permease [Blastomyces gilchristii SLH14081]